ncbi:MAG: hypothetical protein ABEI99_02605 [Halobaculum sp.]
MSDSTVETVQQVGLTAWRTVILLAVTALALGMFGGLAFLVFRGRISGGALLLFAGVILGYALRTAHDVV